MKSVRRTLILLILLSGVGLVSGQAPAEEAEQEFEEDLDWAQVRYVVARRESGGSWRFDVTVRHDDEGWDHYANLWQVVHPETLEVYGERELLHPHDNEQPFTRSRSGITIPDDQTVVRVRARCETHGFGGREVLVDLTTDEGEYYEVRR